MTITKPTIMHYSKWILVSSILLIFACQNDKTSTSTNPSKAPAEKEQPIRQETEPVISQPKIIEAATPASPKEKVTEKPIATKSATKPAAPKKTGNKDIQIKEVESVATKVDVIKKETNANTIQITEVKEKVAGKVQEAKAALPTPPTKVEQPKIIASTPPPPVTKPEVKTPKKEVIELKQELSHTAWDGLLRKYVSSTGKVNYKGLKADKNFETYLKLLADNPIQSSWSRNKKMAYWINAYNAFTIKLIADNYPVSSITKLHGGKPWDHQWIQLGGKTYTLNDIEHKILRPQFKDARIHFAVNCAATSCPPVLNRAWTASNLNSNLDKQAKLFINNAAFNSIDEKKVELSKIFEWYAEDFGDLISYLNKYATTKIKDGATVSYKEYDWGLNE